MTTASGTDHQAPFPMIEAMSCSGHVAMDARPDRDSRKNERPDLADDILHRVAAEGHALRPAQLARPGPLRDAGAVAYTQPSTQRSRRSRPITHPATMAMTKPVPRYNAATFQPKSPKRSTSATSLIMGAAMRKEKVTPRGTPVVTNPMKSGTAEQEQNGVTTPRSEPSTLPSVCSPASEKPSGALRGEEGAHDSHPEDDEKQQHQDLGGLVDEERNCGGKPGCRPIIPSAP